MIFVGVLCFLIGAVVGVILMALMAAAGRWDREEPLYKPEYKVVVQKPGVKVVGAVMQMDRYEMTMLHEGGDLDRYVRGRLAHIMAEKLMENMNIEYRDNPYLNSAEYMAKLRVLDPAFKF